MSAMIFDCNVYLVEKKDVGQVAAARIGNHAGSIYGIFLQLPAIRSRIRNTLFEDFTRFEDFESLRTLTRNFNQSSQKEV